MKNRPIWVVAALLAALVLVQLYGLFARSPVVEGERERVGSFGLEQADIHREQVGGLYYVTDIYFDYKDDSVVDKTEYYQPRGLHRVLFEERQEGSENGGFHLEVYEAPLRKQYPLGITRRVGEIRVFILFHQVDSADPMRFRE